MRTARVVAVLLAAAAGLAGSVRAAEPDLARKAKALFFDRRYSEARDAWQAVLRSARGLEADQAAFWIARSSESLGEGERAGASGALGLAVGAGFELVLDEAEATGWIETHRFSQAIGTDV